MTPGASVTYALIQKEAQRSSTHNPGTGLQAGIPGPRPKEAWGPRSLGRKLPRPPQRSQHGNTAVKAASKSPPLSNAGAVGERRTAPRGRLRSRRLPPTPAHPDMHGTVNAIRGDALPAKRPIANKLWGASLISSQDEDSSSARWTASSSSISMPSVTSSSASEDFAKLLSISRQSKGQDSSASPTLSTRDATPIVRQKETRWARSLTAESQSRLPDLPHSETLSSVSQFGAPIGNRVPVTFTRPRAMERPSLSRQLTLPAFGQRKQPGDKPMLKRRQTVDCMSSLSLAEAKLKNMSRFARTDSTASTSSRSDAPVDLSETLRTLSFKVPTAPPTEPQPRASSPEQETAKPAIVMDKATFSYPVATLGKREVAGESFANCGLFLSKISYLARLEEESIKTETWGLAYRRAHGKGKKKKKHRKKQAMRLT